MNYQTSDFDTLTIPKLIEYLLEQYGVEWQGKKTRRAPIVDHILSLQSQALQADQELEVQSESDPQPTKESAQPPLSVDKALNTSMNELSQKTLSELKEYRDILGVDLGYPYNTRNVRVERTDTLHLLKSTIAKLNRCKSRNLTVDLENCKEVYDTLAMTSKTHSSISELFNKFCPQPVVHLKTRGFHEPDLNFGGIPAALYLCCSLDDNPNPYQYEIGDLVELKPKAGKVGIEGVFDKYLERYEVAEVIEIADNGLLTLGFIKPGSSAYSKVKVTHGLVDRVFCPLEGSQVKLRPLIPPVEVLGWEKGWCLTPNHVFTVLTVKENIHGLVTMVRASIEGTLVNFEAPLTHFMSADRG